MNQLYMRHWIEKEWDMLQRTWTVRLPFAMSDELVQSLQTLTIDQVRARIAELLLAETVR